MGRRRTGAGILVLGILIAAAVGAGATRLLPASPAAAAELSREYLIKAAILYNFAKFTEWPDAVFAAGRATIQVCVYGSDPFGPALESIAGKEVRGRRVEVRRIVDLSASTTCHLLFISDSEATRLDRILGPLRDQPVLTVADIPNFARSGGIVTLKTNDQDLVRFEINVTTARQAGLRLSSKLLSLAEIVPGGS